MFAAYPQLGVDIDVESKGGAGRNPRPAVSVDWGVNPYLYNVEDATLRFIEQVLDEWSRASSLPAARSSSPT